MTLDRNNDGVINFEEFLIGLSVLSRGSVNEKLEWIFDLYDIQKDGVITVDEVRRRPFFLRQQCHSSCN